MPNAIGQEGTEVSFTRTDTNWNALTSVVPASGSGQTVCGSTGGVQIPVGASIIVYGGGSSGSPGWVARASDNLSLVAGFFAGATGASSTVALTVGAGTQSIIPTWFTGGPSNWNDGNFSTTTGVYTVPASGYYQISGQVLLTGSVTLAIMDGARVNLRRGNGPSPNSGSDVTVVSAVPASISVLSGLVSLGIGNVTLPFNCIPYVSKGQILYLTIQNVSGISINVSLSGIPTQTFLSAKRI
jgi:hypothetical protein